MNRNNQRSLHGFTLIELLIVIFLMMLAISLVGPLTFKMLDKANAQSEYITLQNKLKRISYNAFASAAEYQLYFQGTQVKIFKNSIFLSQTNFDYLFFDEQNIYLNSRGYPAPESLVVDFSNKRQEVNLFRLIEGTSGKIDN